MTVAKPLTPQDIYVSSAFNAASSSSYGLGIYVDGDYLLYSITNEQHEPLLLRQYKNRDGLDFKSFMEAVWQQDDIMRKRFRQGQIILELDKWMVIPAEYVPEGQELEYLQAVYDIRYPQAYAPRKEILKGSGVAFLSWMPKNLQEYLQVRTSSFTIYHASHRYTQLSRYLLQTHLQHRSYIGLIWLFLGSFYYVLFAGQNLLFINKFHATTAEDVLYYVQGLHSLLGIDKSEVGIAVGGYSGLKSFVATMMYRFFGAGYRDLGKLYPPPPTLKEVGLGMEDILHLSWVGADSAG
ncbi:MAG: DUF3822 family protein [Bacteroidia bacterium]|nr:DUF3822 family protein [Bacteroidia bacterium]MDW8235402.1 DUF3822 family protein [Bacteroidia bacterium]